MRAAILLTALLACAGDAHAQSARSYPASGFTTVTLAGPDDVLVRTGTAFSVRAEGPAEVLDRLDIVAEGGTLRIGRKRNASGWNVSRGGARIVVTMPAIAAATLAGSGNFRVNRAVGEAFAARLAGSGNLRVDEIASRAATIDLGGSGNVAAGGRVERLTVSLSGSGNVEAPALVARSAQVRLAGSGGVTARVDGTASVMLAGSGDVVLGPNARCQTRKTGSGTVRCGA